MFLPYPLRGVQPHHGRSGLLVGAVDGCLVEVLSFLHRVIDLMYLCRVESTILNCPEINIIQRVKLRVGVVLNRPHLGGFVVFLDSIST